MGKKKVAGRPASTGDWRQRLQLAVGANTKDEAAKICRSLLSDMAIDDNRRLH